MTASVQRRRADNAADAAATAANATVAGELVFDLRDRNYYSRTLLHRVYSELMIPQFPLEDEREPLEHWEHYLTQDEPDPGDSEFHLGLAVQCETTPDAEPVLDPQTCIILGICVFEYYPDSQCGFISYLVTNEKYRKRGLSRKLIRFARDGIQSIAKRNGVPGGVRTVVLETNAPETLSEDEDVFDGELRHEIIERLGFSAVEFSYIQPAIREGLSPVYSLHFCVLRDSPAVREADEQFPHGSVDASAVRDWYTEFCSVLQMRNPSENPVYIAVMRSVDRHAKNGRLPLMVHACRARIAPVTTHGVSGAPAYIHGGERRAITSWCRSDAVTGRAHRGVLCRAFVDLQCFCGAHCAEPAADSAVACLLCVLAAFLSRRDRG